MTTTHRPLLALSLAAFFGAGVALTVHHTVRADGIPAMNPLLYGGSLEDNGRPAEGTRTVRVGLWDAPTGGAERCSASATVTLNAGRFNLPLGDDCTAAVQQHPNLWSELRVGSETFAPRARLGAVPYAVEAHRASGAAGTLQSQIAMMQSQIATLTSQLAAERAPDVACPRGYDLAPGESPGTVCVRTVALGGAMVRDEVVKVGTGASAFWVDRYEASAYASANGARTTDVTSLLPRNGQRTAGSAPVMALSTEAAPLVSVTWFQANELCRAAGKRLPTGDEWLAAASGTPDTTVCNTSNTGTRAASRNNQCRSASGAHDMIGNVWEWTAEWYAGVGAANTTAAWNVTDYAGDGTWNIASSAYSGSDGIRSGIPSAALRGGNWAERGRTGVFALSLDYAPSHWHSAVGFRCALQR